MARYIDADLLISEIDELKKSPWYNNDYDGRKFARQEAVSIVVNLCIKRAPTADVVEVIRCKDCTLRKTEDCAMYYECDGCRVDELNTYEIPPKVELPKQRYNYRCLDDTYEPDCLHCVWHKDCGDDIVYCSKPGALCVNARR